MMRSAFALLLFLGAHNAACAAGDALTGQELYESKCAGCHAVDANRVGPAHRGVFGRKAGSVAGFSYSPALRGSRLIWDSKSLERWLTNPEELIPGQAMYFQVSDAESRKNIVAYLATLKP
jgi:cytochrome c